MTAAALILLAAASGAAAPANSSRDAAAVISQVLASEARIYGAPPGPTPCLRREVDELTFTDARISLTRIAGDSASLADRQRAARTAGEHAWTAPSGKPGEWATKQKLDPEQAQALSAAAAAIIAEPAAARAVTALAPNWVPPPLRFCSARSQLPRVEVAEPAFHGDFAFVEAGFACSGLCGNGLLYALRRKHGAWEIVSVVFTWIS